MAMERALSFLADAERALDDSSSCLVRDVIVSEAQATEHRSIACAKEPCLPERDKSEANMRRFADIFMRRSCDFCIPAAY